MKNISKKFGFKFRKTRPNRRVTEEKKTYIYIYIYIYIQKDNEITEYFSHHIHAQFYLNKVLQFFTQMLSDIFYCLNESCICFFLFPFCPVYEI